MAISKGYLFLNLLSSFWIKFYEDAQVMESALQAEAEMLKTLYFSFLQEQVPRAVQDAPIFREEFWNLIQLIADDAQGLDINGKVTTIPTNVVFIRYPLDDSYAHIPLLYDVIFNPKVIYREDLDLKGPKNSDEHGGFFRVERESVDLTDGEGVEIRSYIIFRKEVDPFRNNNIARRILSGNKLSLTLFAPKSYVDKEDLYSKYGVLVKIRDVSSLEYKNFLAGLFYLYLNGPSTAAINAGLSLAAGYPVAEDEEIITSVDLREKRFLLKSDKGNIYEILRKLVDVQVGTSIVKQAFPLLTLSNKPQPSGLLNPDFSNIGLQLDTEYAVYWPVQRLDSFLDNLKIVDDTTQPYWWRESSEAISSALAPQLTPLQRANPHIKDTLFQKFFKYNTFGVFIDYRVFREDFLKVPDFLNILREVKPTYKSFMVFDREFEVFTIVQLGSDSTNTDNVQNSISLDLLLDIEEVSEIILTIGMSLPPVEVVEIGMALEDLGHSYDQVYFDIGLNPENGGPTSIQTIPEDTHELIVGQERYIGMAPTEGVFEGPTFELIFLPDATQGPDYESDEVIDWEYTILPEDTVSEGSDIVQLVAIDNITTMNTLCYLWFPEGYDNITGDFSGNLHSVEIVNPQWIPHYGTRLGGQGFKGSSFFRIIHEDDLNITSGTWSWTASLNNLNGGVFYKDGSYEAYIEDGRLYFSIYDENDYKLTYRTVNLIYSENTLCETEIIWNNSTKAPTFHLNAILRNVELIEGVAGTFTTIKDVTSNLIFGKVPGKENLSADIYEFFIETGIKPLVERQNYFNSLGI